jgi:hypothetical protein
MSEKKMPKAKLERVVELTMDIHDSAQYASIDENVKRRSTVAQSISNSYPYFYWSVIDLVESVLTFSGKTDGLLEQTCKVLEALGWQVVDDEQSDG